MNGLAVLVPAFNEGPSLPALIRELVAQGCPLRHILVINDGSGDDTLAVARSLGVATLDLAIRLGIGGTVQAGYRWALERDFHWAVQVDGDGQHDPAALPALLGAAVATAGDMVIGSRFVAARGGYRSTWLRRLGIAWFSGLIRFVTGRRIHDPTSGMRLVGRRLMKSFAEHYPADFPEPETLARILAAGYTVEEVAVCMRERGAGRSSIDSVTAVYYAVKVTLGVVLGAVAGRLERRRHAD